MVGASELDDNSVDTAALIDDAVTGPKINSSALTDKDAGDQIGIANSITSGTYAGADYNAQGLITGVPGDGIVPRADLPIATDSELGVVEVPTAGGLTVSGTGELSIANTVTGATATKITFDNRGLVTNGEALTGADLPRATTTDLGGVIVPDKDGGDDTPLDIDGDGKITHATSAVTGTYTKVTVDKWGHTTVGANLGALIFQTSVQIRSPAARCRQPLRLVMLDSLARFTPPLSLIRHFSAPF